MTATTGVGGLIYGRALVDQRTGKKINFDELGGGNIPEDITDLIASKAPIESPSLTGTPTAPTAAQGTNSTQIANTAFVKAAITTLINGAPSTLDTLKEIAAAINNDPNFSTTINNALALKAPLASPALTGVPTAPTAAQGTNNMQIATTAYVRAAISALVGSSPEALDTLNELAAALGNDPNFATTMTNALALKAPLSSPALTGTPTAPTPSDSASGTQIANVDFVKKQVSNNTYTLSAGTVTVLDSGSQPTIEITGQSPSQVLNLGIPKAPDGQTIKSVNAVVKEIDSAQQVTLTFTMTDDTNQQASFNIPFSPQPTMKLSATSGNFSFNYSDTPSAKNAAGRSGSSIYLKTTVDLNRAPAGSTDVMVDVRLTEIPCTEDGTYLDYDIYAEYPSVVGSGQPTVAVWLILPTVPTHTIDPKTKTITKLLRGDGLSGLNGIIPIAGADEQVHEFKYFLQYSYLNN